MNKKLVVALLMLASTLLFSTMALAAPNEEARLRAEERRETQQVRAEERRERVETMKADVKARVEAKKASINQARCERLQTRIESKAPKLANSALVQQKTLDVMYERVTGFYESGQLTTPEYDSLNEAIVKEQTETEVAITALSDVEVVVDCDDASTANKLSTYRESLVVVKQQIKDYRKALVDLISSLRSAEAADEERQDDNAESSDDPVEVDTPEQTETDTDTDAGADETTDEDNV